MCSIMGTAGKAVKDEEFKDGFQKTKSRGPDDTRIINLPNGKIGFHRLAIMGLNSNGMQPFELNGNYLACNGEIYGFRSIKKELSSQYSFAGESDCEILLPMYEKYGNKMFEMLDAEFALIIYDSKKGRLIAARDPIGIRPLYYGYREMDNQDSIIFASEPKNLVGICEHIMPFPPGHYYADGKFVKYRDLSEAAPRQRHITDIPSDFKTCRELDEICGEIRSRLTIGVTKRLDSDAKIGCLLSGGLDSSLVCSIAKKALNAPIRTFAIGMCDDAIDLKYARQVADYIGSIHTEVIISKDDVLGSLETVIAALGTFDITTIRAGIGMYLVCKYIHENTDIRVLLTGEISDELFGYKYTDFAPSADEFQKEAAKRIRELHMYDVLRADRCISVNSLEARVPFGDLDFVKYVMEIDPEYKINRYGMGKYLLRRAFDMNGDYLPDNILWRDKAAFSDAVGHSMVNYLKEYADAYYTDRDYEVKRVKYSHAAPFTKESLLYREIFEKYYPGQSNMISDFWMPNKSWEGCNVSDPSARVLSNYGNSGI